MAHTLLQSCLRWLAVGAVALSVSGCPPECESGTPPELVAPEQDPSLGTFSGTLSWLQTGEETEATLTVRRLSSEATLSCMVAHAQTHFELMTSDGVVSTWNTKGVRVDPTGVLVPVSHTLPLSAEELIEAGKIPEAPGLETRDPIAGLHLTPEDDGRVNVSVTVRSATDHLTVALGTLSAVGAP